MLVRDLASMGSNRWRREGSSFLLHGPLGSRAVVSGPEASGVVETLRSSGPKALQVFTALVELWSLDTGGEDPEAPASRSVSELAAWMDGGGGAAPARERARVAEAVGALARTRFLEGPPSLRAGHPPGPPVEIQSQSPDDHNGPLVFRPGPGWVRDFRGRTHRVAKLPRGFLSMHARNQRYQILLSFYLSIMLRVNRKHGFFYAVNLRTLLEGAGIPIPARNVSRFISAIYGALAEVPGVRCKAPRFSWYSAEELLAAKLAFWLDHDMTLAYRPSANGGLQRAF